jgi:hypothetical protein
MVKARRPAARAQGRVRRVTTEVEILDEVTDEVV